LPRRWGRCLMRWKDKRNVIFSVRTKISEQLVVRKAKTLNLVPTSRPPTPIVAGMGVDDAATHCGWRVLRLRGHLLYYIAGGQ
jgi:hypothetical protein